MRGLDLRSDRTILILCLALGVYAPLGAGGATAQAHKGHHSHQADQDDTPDTTATIPQAKVTPSPAENPETLPAPFHLPNASRARMHECGLKWDVVKMAGEAGDETWREFGTRCLAATGGPNISPSH